MERMEVPFVILQKNVRPGLRETQEFSSGDAEVDVLTKYPDGDIE